MTKHEPAFPMLLQSDYVGEPDFKKLGFTKYEEVAARFMAAEISSYGAEDTVNDKNAAIRAFNAADAFFAELEKRGAK